MPWRPWGYPDEAARIVRKQRCRMIDLFISQVEEDGATTPEACSLQGGGGVLYLVLRPRQPALDAPVQVTTDILHAHEQGKPFVPLLLAVSG